MRVGALFAGWLLVLAFTPLLPTAAAAHETRPVYLELTELEPDQFQMTIRTPMQGNSALAVKPVLPEGCDEKSRRPAIYTGLSAVERRVISCQGGLSGKRITFDGLPGTMVDGLVRIEYRNGQAATATARPGQPYADLPAMSDSWGVFFTYARLGTEHILAGIDHLMFVGALVLLLGNLRRIMVAVTAFTLSHSVSLSLAALGYFHVPLRATEALIALTIVMLAVELAKPAGDSNPHSLRERPFLMAFAFGLLHGLGFASGLSEVGLPNHAIPVALISFNVGVEVGQFGFVCCLLAVGSIAKRLLPARQLGLAAMTVTYVIGGCSAYWMIERLATIG